MLIRKINFITRFSVVELVWTLTLKALTPFFKKNRTQLPPGYLLNGTVESKMVNVMIIYVVKLV